MLYFVASLSTRRNPYTHKKKKQPTALFQKAKLLFFSVLLAISQRNNHFSGCKGTYLL